MIQFPDAINRAIDARLAGVHTALPGRIESYDYTTQKADVQPLIKKRYRDGTEQSLPVITDVPVVWPRAGGASLTFPIQQGDGVLLVFAERGLANWLSLGDEQPPPDFAKHQLTDAIAIPGLNDFTTAGLADNNEDVLLVFGSSEVRLKPDGEILISNGNGALRIDSSNKVALGNTSQELLDIVDQIISDLIASTVPTQIGPQQLSKVTDGTFATLQADLAQIKGSL